MDGLGAPVFQTSNQLSVASKPVGATFLPPLSCNLLSPMASTLSTPGSHSPPLQAGLGLFQDICGHVLPPTGSLVVLQRGALFDSGLTLCRKRNKHENAFGKDLVKATVNWGMV